MKEEICNKNKKVKESILIILIISILSMPITMAATSQSRSNSSNSSEIVIVITTATPIQTPTPTIPPTANPPGLIITTDTSSVQVGISKTVTFYVTKTEDTVTCMAIDCPTATPASVPISGAYVSLKGIATGTGSTDTNGRVTININANSAGTITATASKSGYSDGTTTITAQMPPTQQPSTPPSVTFVSDKNSYIRNDLIYLTMKNSGEQSVILSNSNTVHWWIENIIYSSPMATDATGDSSASAIASSDSSVYNTQLFPGGSITVPWDQRDSNKNLVSQGKYRACVSWSYNGQYYQSCTQSFDIIVQDTPTPPPITPDIPTPIQDTPTPTPIPRTYIPTSPVPSPSLVQPKKDNFRVGPTVNLRPVKDEITKNEDGLIELYVDNPSLNDVMMYTDVRISVPSGISVYGQGFGDAGSAGVLHGTFDISPGKSRTIQMTVKAEKTGEFLIKFSGLYWPGNNKDAYQPISLTHNFKVYDLAIPTITTTAEIVHEGRFDIIKWFMDLLDKILGPT